jgi:hypothetical protein
MLSRRDRLLEGAWEIGFGLVLGAVTVCAAWAASAIVVFFATHPPK